MLGALASAAGGLAQSGIQFGANYGAALLDAKIQRSLRRTVYQDQMHSMRQAGLNPILAAGSTPQMGTPGTMDAPDVAKAIQTSANTSKTSDERTLLKAQADTAVANAQEARAKALTADAIRDATRIDLENKGRIGGLEGDFLDKTFNSRVGLVDTDYERAGYAATRENRTLYTSIDNIRRQNDLLKADIEKRRAEAGLTSAREEGVQYENIGKGIDAKWLREYESLVRAGKTADQIYDILGPAAGVFLKGRGQVLGDRRDRRTDARQRDRDAAQDQRARERTYEGSTREQDRRDRAEAAREYQSDY